MSDSEYEVSWQVYGVRTVAADSEDAAQAAVDEWLEDEHGLTAQVADGWDYGVRAL